MSLRVTIEIHLELRAILRIVVFLVGVFYS